MTTITLKSNGVGRYNDVSPVIITDRKLNLKIALPPVKGDFYFVAENNGTTQKRLLPQNGEIALENLTAGELNAEIRHYVKGVIVKVYKVEPLILKEVDGNIKAEPEFSALDRRICAVESGLNAANRDLTEINKSVAEQSEKLNKRLARVNKNLAALIRFAFKAYNASPFLGGGTADRFAEEFGFDLPEDEIKTIKGETDND